MAYSIAVGDVIEWTVRMNLYGQQCLMVNHFKANTGFVTADSVTIFDDMNTELGSGLAAFRNLFQSCVTQDLTIEQFIFQKIHPTRFARRIYVYNTTGSQADPADTANVAAVLTKRSELSTARHSHLKQGQIGSIHIPGVPKTQYTAGVLVPDYVNGVLTALANELVSDFTTPALNHLDWVLWHRNAVPPTADTIVQCFPEDTVRTMRGRTVGKGV